MRFVDEFRDPVAARDLSRRIRTAAEAAGRPLRFMEVCGGHTMAIHRFGIPELLPDGLELLSGPGCPVCVTPVSYLDRAIEIASEPDRTVATFGDLHRVPGRAGSLEDAAADGADVRVVYGPRDALELARRMPAREVVFLAIGFETTAPATAATLREARAAGVRNLRVLPGHKTMPPALRALVGGDGVALDGLLLPGHVCTVTGSAPYEFLAREYGLACCITGFEPADVLLGVLSLVEQAAFGRPLVDNRYRRAVHADGNPRARAAVQAVFAPADSRWRGIGTLPGSGLDLREDWHPFRVEPPPPDAPDAEQTNGYARHAEFYARAAGNHPSVVFYSTSQGMPPENWTT